MAWVRYKLKRLDIEVAVLQETRLSVEGQIKELASGYTFFWKGLPKDDKHIYGIGLAIKTNLVVHLKELPTGLSKWIMTPSAYTPTLDANDTVKENFDADLYCVIVHTLD